MGSVGSAGRLSFAVSLACVVLLQGCRHSLGRSARMAFLLLSSFMSGLAATVVIFALREGMVDSAAILPPSGGLYCSYMGLAFGLHLLGGVLALVSIVENRWRMAFFLVLLAIAGNAAGLFAFAPVYLSAAAGGAVLLVLTYVVVFSSVSFPGTDGLKLLVICGISLAAGGLLVAAFLPKALLGERLAAFSGLAFFPARYWDVRRVLSAVAFKSWISHIWIGTGLESFPLDFRFGAKADDWAILPRGAAMPTNGWWLILVERGLVGGVFFVLPFAFLLTTYVRRMISGLLAWKLPHPLCLLAPVALLLFVADGFFDCALLRADVLTAMCAFLAVSAASFQRRRGGRNG